MIIGMFHQGSGLGNQLHRLVATRVKALELGVDWAMSYRHDGSGKEKGFKGSSFMDIGEWDKGKKLDVVHYNPQVERPEMVSGYWEEKKVVDDFGNDIRSYDPEFNFIEDNTIIEGEFQDERYWEKYEREVNKWLKVEPLGEQKGWICNGEDIIWWEKPEDKNCVPYKEMSDNLCVIGFRGGEYRVFPDLFLTKEYWEEAIKKMKEINQDMIFEVHTDDKETAREFFPSAKIVQDIGLNWRSMRYAKYAIIANSSFFILPRWLSRGVTIAPRYWARRNTKVWALPQNYYKRFTYI